MAESTPPEPPGTGSEPGSEHGSDPGGAPARRPRRWRRSVGLAAVVVVLALVAAGVAVGEQGAGRYYAFAPGTAPVLTPSAACKGRTSPSNLTLPNGTPCARVVVPPSHQHTISGRLYMVDVLVGKATPLEYLLDKVGLLQTFHGGMRLISAAAVLGNAPSSQLNCQDAQEMAGARMLAGVVALRHLGYNVTGVLHGAQIDLVVPGSPAAKAGVACNDVVHAVGNTPISSAQQLVKVIHSLHPGSTTTLSLTGPGAGGSRGSSTPRKVTVKLTSTPALDGEPANPHLAFLGVAIQNELSFKLPLPVSVKVGNIGGPSAGLAMTLGLLDVLSNGQLTGGHRVAATGTISLNGAVGAVGGVAQKAVAVRRAGAQVFFVPPANLKSALSGAGPHLKVMAVSSLAQALADLASLGGKVPVTSPGKLAFVASSST